MPPCIMCVQYIGGYNEYIGGYHEYIGGIPWVHRRDIMSTSEGYHEYIGGVQYIGVFNKLKGFYHLAPPHASLFYLPLPPSPPPDVLNTHYTGWMPLKLNLSLKYFNDKLLMVSPRCSEHTLYRVDTTKVKFIKYFNDKLLMVSPDVLNTHYTGWIPLKLNLSNILMINYSWYLPDVLNTHYTGWIPLKLNLSNILMINSSF